MVTPRMVSTLVRNCVLVLASVLFLGSIPGCGDDDTTCPSTPGGTIRGTILAAGKPVNANLQAWALPDSGQSFNYIQNATTDSMGAYSMEVPPGNYRLQVSASRCGRYYSHGGLVALSADAETLAVQTGETITADLNFGALRVELDTPGLSGTAFVRLADLESRCNLVSNPVQLQDGHATFEIPLVDPGTYRMLLDLTDGNRVWLPGVLESAEADTITIVAGHERIYETTLPEAAVLHGTVTGSWQQLGLPPPRVYLYDPNASHIYVSTRVSSADGSYTIPLCAWVHVLMKITIAGTESWYGGATVTEALAIDIAPGETEEVDIRESGIAGWLNRQPSPYSGPVEVWSADSTARGVGAPSGNDGFFRISNLEPGTYYLSIPAGPDWIAQWYDRADSFADATPVEVTEEGQVVWLNLDLEDGGKIEGHLLRGDGSPAYGLFVGLLPADSENMIQTGASNGEGGAFVFPGLPDGDYRIIAWPNQSGGWVYYPGVTDPTQAEILSIRDHTPITGIVFQLP